MQPSPLPLESVKHFKTSVATLLLGCHDPSLDRETERQRDAEQQRSGLCARQQPSISLRRLVAPSLRLSFSPSLRLSFSPSLRLSISLSLLALASLLPIAAGCSEAEKRRWRVHTAEQNFRDALQAPQGDIRREAVIAIAGSGYLAREDAFQVLSTVARTDPIHQVRCIAIRVLGGYYDARPVRPLLQILQATADSKDALPGNDDVRWEAASTLLTLERKDVLNGSERDEACGVYIKLLESDPSRCVKIVSAGALGRFKDRRVFRPLFVALRNKDFAIADEAERSLIALTGVRHDYDPDAWEKWVAAAPDPFANAGQAPPTSRPAGPTWFDKQINAWRRGLKLKNAG